MSEENKIDINQEEAIIGGSNEKDNAEIEPSNNNQVKEDEWKFLAKNFIDSVKKNVLRHLINEIRNSPKIKSIKKEIKNENEIQEASKIEEIKLNQALNEETNDNEKEDILIESVEKVENSEILKESSKEVEVEPVAPENIQKNEPENTQIEEKKEEIIDFENLYQNLVKLKDESNNLYNKDPNEGLSSYLRTNNEIDSVISLSKNKENPRKNDLMNLKKLVFSNIARAYEKLEKYKESILFDEAIILKLDEKFEKSYGRLILNYIKLGEIEKAKGSHKQMCSLFDQNTLEKYKDNVFSTLKIAIEQDNENRKRIARRLVGSLDEKKLLEEKLRKEKEAQEKMKKPTSQKNSYGILNYLFGTGIVIGSLASLFFLYKARNKFFS